MNERAYQVCSRCVMDISAADIRFDEAGVCNYCAEFLQRSGHILHKSAQLRVQEREAFLGQIRQRAARGKYGCVVGVSGGVDSSWALVQAVKANLRPLAVHMDNGWNTELAQHNIANLIRSLGVDLHTHVIDWREYRQLMQAFFDADVIDVELLYDNAMLAVNYQQAARHGVKSILGGTNQATEGMRIPGDWNWFKFDRKNIEALGGTFRKVRLRTFPAIGTWGYIWYEYVRRIRWISFLDFFDYNKAAALAELQRDYGYKPYPYKHYESVFTRFYQGYLLPQKFGVDKRRVHFSTLVAAGQMTREEALGSVSGIAYPSERALQEDRQYFLKKMGWSEADLDAYIRRPPKPHAAYPSEKGLWEFLQRMYKRIG